MEGERREKKGEKMGARGGMGRAKRAEDMQRRRIYMC